MRSRGKVKSLRQSRPMRGARKIYRLFFEFTQLAASGGKVLMAAAILALVWANSPWSAQYFDFWHTEVRLGFGEWMITEDLHWWINDALMVVFFFVVGLEIKREILVGELASVRQAALPIAAAIGGMLLPALIYLSFNTAGPGSSGWGVPMATDIAFALGVMALLGTRVPLALKVFLTALAIVDDIGAVIVIALFYTSSVSWLFLAIAAGILFLLFAVNILGVRNLMVYSILGICLWLAILSSGLHATLAGVLLAMTIPASRKINRDDFLQKAHDDIHAFENARESNQRLLSASQQDALISLETTVENVEVPLQKMEHALQPWVVFVILPLFALANTGVAMGENFTALLLDRVSLGIMAGLVLGKQIGVTVAAWTAVKLGFAEFPAGVTWRSIYAVGWLAGIGFTMSLFISGLAFANDAEFNSAKVGILCASLLAGFIGYALLRLFVPKDSDSDIPGRENTLISPEISEQKGL